MIPTISQLRDQIIRIPDPTIFMSLAFILTPVSIALEVIICGMGIYAGYFMKKTFGYLFAVTFLIFAIFDWFGSIGISTDILSVLNIIAVLASFVGVYLIVREKQTKTV